VINFKTTIITVTRNRSSILQSKAIPSLLEQTDQDFKWVVVNDGADPQTCQVIDRLQTNFPIVYREIEHAEKGFGLAHGRNCGLEASTGDIVCYLDDDNSLAPNYLTVVKAFFRSPTTQAKPSLMILEKYSTHGIILSSIVSGCATLADWPRLSSTGS
jgi:glycosyltransferase involved in cell wall biosynthesis